MTLKGVRTYGLTLVFRRKQKQLDKKKKLETQPRAIKDTGLELSVGKKCYMS